MPILDGFRDEELHPSIVEAVKKLGVVKDAAVHGCQSIEAQYLAALTGLGGAALEQANAVRMLMGQFPVAAHEQAPAAAVTTASDEGVRESGRRMFEKHRQSLDRLGTE